MIFGIMGAMPDEVDQLCARLENVTVEPYGGVEYHKGTLAGKQVVVCCACQRAPVVLHAAVGFHGDVFQAGVPAPRLTERQA